MTQPKTITIDDTKYVRADSVDSYTMAENFVIARCRDAGVHAGELVSRKDGVIKLKNSRRLWRWWSKFTLSGLATCGVLESKKEHPKFACILPELDLTESDVCEIIYCTEHAQKSIMSFPEHKNY